MVAKNTALIISDGGKNARVALSAAAPQQIDAAAGVKYLLHTQDGAAPQNVTVTRSGDDLQITLEGDEEPALVLRDYFVQPDPVGLYGISEDGQLHAYVRTDGDTGGIFSLGDGEAEPLALGADDLGLGAPYLETTDDDGFVLWPLLLGGLGLAAVGAAIYDRNRGDGGNKPQGPGAPTLEVADDAGPLASGATTNDGTPTFSGQAVPGNTVVILDGATPIGSTVAGADGAWSFTPEVPLADGPHAVVAQQKDPAGQTSPSSMPVDVVIDTEPPAPPVIVGAADDVGPVQGVVPNDGTTDDTTPVISGTAEPGATVALYDGATLLQADIPVGPDGTWTYAPATPLGEGRHNFIAMATDAAGNVGGKSDWYSLTVDAAAATLAITSAYDDHGDVTGAVVNGGTTDDVRPLIQGTGPADAIVMISVVDGAGNARELGSAQVQADGTWSFAVTDDLPLGVTTFTAAEASGASDPSAPYVLTLSDPTFAPQAPTIVSVQDDVGTIHYLQKGETTNDATPTIRGTAQKGSVVQVYDGQTLLGEVVADADGGWRLTPSALADGAHAITATATDVAGKVSERTGEWDFIVDTTAPAKPDGYDVTDDVGPETGPIPDGGTTDDSQPEFSGGGVEPGAVVVITDDGEPIGSSVVGPDGAWSVLPEAPIPDGPHDIEVVVIDPAGNETQADPVNIIVDTTDVAVSITRIVDNVDPVRGPVVPDGSTNDVRPEIQGSGTPGYTVTVYDGGQELGSTTVSESGSWSLVPPLAFAEGRHVITAGTVDANGAEILTPEMAFTVDTVAAAVPSIDNVMDDVGARMGSVPDGGVTDDPTPTLSGRAESGTTVDIYDNGAVVAQDVPVRPDGTWSYTFTNTIAEGEHAFTAKATDAAGNVSDASSPFQLITDYTAPFRPMITAVVDNQLPVAGTVADGGSSDDRTPTLQGRGTAGHTIVVNVSDSAGTQIRLGEATVQADGSWVLDVGQELSPGVNTFTAVEMDAAGNRASSEPYGVTVVTSGSAPPAPAIVSVQDDVGAVHFMQKGEVTDDTTPIIRGTAQPGATVKVYDGASLIGEVPADADGYWQVVSKPLADGPHQITATATDPSGRTSDPTGVWDFAVDTAAPGAPGAFDVIDDVGPITGPVADGGTTDDTAPEITGGGAEPGAVVTVLDNGEAIGSGVVDQDGDWSVVPDDGLADGPHAITVVVTDPAGNNSAPSAPTQIVVDTSGSSVRITRVLDNVDPLRGIVGEQGRTNDTQPEIQGIGKPASTVTVRDADGTDLGQATVKSDGTWSVTPARPLAQGSHSVTATAVDAAGVEASAGPVRFTVDSLAPARPSIDGVYDDVGGIQGDVPGGGVTDDPTPTFGGKAEPGATVTLLDAGTVIATGIAVEADGSWRFTPPSGLPEGGHLFTVIATDGAGNVSDPSAVFDITTDYTAPQRPAITGVSDDAGAVQGNVPDGGVTDDLKPQIQGTGTAGNTIVVEVTHAGGTRELGRTQVRADGTWALEVTQELPLGNDTLLAVELDAAGNEALGDAYALTVVDPDAAPQAPTIVSVQDDVGVIHYMQKGEVTDDATPTIRGTAEPGTLVKVYDGALLVGAASTDPDGSWELTPGAELADGPHAITATATDAVGRVSDPTGVWAFTVDTAAPGAPGGFDIIDNVGPSVGELSDGDTTDDDLPEIRGAGAEPGSTITVLDGGAPIGSATVQPDGSWSVLPDAALPDGAHAIAVVVTDPAGNDSAPSAPVNLVVDTTGVTVSITRVLDDVDPVQGLVPGNGVTNDTRPEIQGTGKSGSTVTIYDNGQELGVAVVQPNGTWQLTPNASLAVGEHAIVAKAVDAAGAQATSPAVVFTVDVASPAIPTIEGASDDVGVNQGTLAHGGVTDDPTPTLNGRAEPGSTITLYDGGAPIARNIPVLPDGTWSYTQTTNLPEGEHKFTATATDAAGNVGDQSNDFDLTTDYTAPTNVVAIESVTDDTGVAGDFITSDTTLSVNGSLSQPLAAGDKVQVSADGGKTWADAAIATGATAWTYEDPRTLAEGEHTYMARVVDQAGNVGSEDAQTVTVDSTPPAGTNLIDIVSVTDDTGVAGDFITSDTTLTVNGTLAQPLAAGEKAQISVDGGATWADVPVNGALWSYVDARTLPLGNQTYDVRVVDLAGNVGSTDTQDVSIVNPRLVRVDAVDTQVHEAALADGSGRDWIANDGRTTTDTTASGTFQLDDKVTQVTIELGGRPTGLSLSDLATNPTATVEGDSLTITSMGNGQYAYTYTLAQVKSHDTSAGAVGELGDNDLVITATAADGRTDSATGKIDVVNDQPVTVSPANLEINLEGAPDGVNITLVMDDSTSMRDNYDGGGGLSRTAQMLESSIALLDKYEQVYSGAATEFRVTVVPFVRGTVQTFDNLADAKAYLESYQTAYNLAGTEYDKGLTRAQAAIEPEIAARPTWDQKVYFMTDGEPNIGQGVPSAWKTFVADNDDTIDVYGVGIGASATTANGEAQIKAALPPSEQVSNFVPVDNPADLTDSLANTIGGERGNILTALDSDGTGLSADGSDVSVQAGADGGLTIDKVTLDGVEYTFGSNESVLFTVAPGITMEVQRDGDYEVITSLTEPDADVTLEFEAMDADGDRLTFTRDIHFVEEAGASDAFHVTTDTFPAIDGGGGIDYLVLDGSSMNVDLSALDVKNVERFELGAGNNTLTLNAADVQANGEQVNGKAQVIVNGDNGEVDLTGTAGATWASTGNTTVDGISYNVYTNTAMTSVVLVEDKVVVAIL